MPRCWSLFCCAWFCGQSEGALTHSPIHSLAAHSPLKDAAAIPVADPSDGSHTVCAVRKLAYERGLKTLPHRESHHAHSPSHFAQACKPCAALSVSAGTTVLCTVGQHHVTVMLSSACVRTSALCISSFATRAKRFMVTHSLAHSLTLTLLLTCFHCVQTGPPFHRHPQRGIHSRSASRTLRRSAAALPLWASSVPSCVSCSLVDNSATLC
jgi:hypothetical protein